MVELGVAAGRDVVRLVSDPELLSLRLELVDLGVLATAFRSQTVTVETEGTTLVRGDPTRLRQVVANLVTNSLRHGTRVTIETSERGRDAVLLLADDGPGFPDGFDPFAYATSGAGSTGYGLWLARTIVEAHGGRIELDRAARPGARLRLTLPSASGEP